MVRAPFFFSRRVPEDAEIANEEVFCLSPRPLRLCVRLFLIASSLNYFVPKYA
jgi:hypothetical protein